MLRCNRSRFFPFLFYQLWEPPPLLCQGPVLASIGIVKRAGIQGFPSRSPYRSFPFLSGVSFFPLQSLDSSSDISIRPLFDGGQALCLVLLFYLRMAEFLYMTVLLFPAPPPPSFFPFPQQKDYEATQRGWSPPHMPGVLPPFRFRGAAGSDAQG